MCTFGKVTAKGFQGGVKAHSVERRRAQVLGQQPNLLHGRVGQGCRVAYALAEQVKLNRQIVLYQFQADSESGQGLASFVVQRA